METTTKVLIGVGVGAAALASFGLYEHYKSQGPAVLTGSPNVTITPGAMTPVQLSYNGQGTYTLNLPAGAQWPQNMTAITSSNPSVIPTPTPSGTSISFTPQAQGQTTLTINWVDNSAKTYTSTVPVTVSA